MNTHGDNLEAGMIDGARVTRIFADNDGGYWAYNSRNVKYQLSPAEYAELKRSGF
jgi:hypothetical protein